MSGGQDFATSDDTTSLEFNGEVSSWLASETGQIY
jgi:hypothetical protein